MLLNPAGIRQPERVAAVRAKYEKLNLQSIPVSPPVRRRVSAASLRAHRGGGEGDLNYTGGDAPGLRGASVTVEWFDVFGVHPMLGRVFTADEDQPNANQGILLSYAAWHACRWRRLDSFQDCIP